MPWEDAVEEAYERKILKYVEIAVDVEQRGWKAKGLPCRSWLSRLSG